MALTAKQRRFVAEYLIDLNATQAAIRAGYSKRSAASIGEENLRKPEIAAAITERQNKILGDAEATAAEVLRELKRIGLSDIRKLYHSNGKLKHPRELDDDTAAMLAQVETLEEIEGHGDERTLIGHTQKVKAWDKIQALKLLGSRLGLWIEKREITGKDGAPLPAPETHVHVTLTDRIDQYAAAFEGAADRSSESGVPGDGDRKPVGP